MKRNIIDSHCHLGSYFNFFVPGPTAEDMIKSMDNIGIAKSCICPHLCLTSDIKMGNKYMIDTVLEYPDRFIGLFTYNPHFPDLMKEEIDIAFRTKEVRGIKIHQGTHKTDLMNPAYRYLYDFANKYHLPILVHTWAVQTIKEIEILSSEYPNAVFIMGHYGATPANMLIAANVVKNRRNVLGDTALSMMYEGNIEWLTELVGADKILFGTDTPFFDPRICFGRIYNAKIKESQKTKILGQNIIDIFEDTKNYEI